MKAFTHLHTHSHYSLLNALPKIPELVKAAKADGMKALALTDNGNLYGAIDFFKECEKQEIKPIIGVDAYMALRSRTDKQAGVDSARSRLVLLAKDEDGYKNLIELVTRAYLDGFYYKPRIDKEILEKNKYGIVCISPSFSGEIAIALKGSDEERAIEIARWYKKVFGEDFYIEITHHPEIDGHEELMQKLIVLARTENIEIVAAHDTYYLKPEDRRARETLISIQNSNGEGNRGGFDDTEEDFSFISQEKANALFIDTPEALENTQKIVGKCNLHLTFGSWVFPDYKVESGLGYDEELRRVAYDGIQTRNLVETPEILERVEYELEVIKKKGYSPYFLVVSDLLRHARSEKIFSTTRGSAAGSMVSYLTYITTVDPMLYKLPFERFLNPERPSAPDIDMDIADNRRDEMIAYAVKKYGADNVAQIGTFGTMMARGAVRDVARALGYPYALGDRISKMIPMGSQGFAMTIDRAFGLVPELKEMYEREHDVKEIIDMARKIEGCARHISVHAAGVVISPKKLTEYIPLQFDPKGEGKIITQFDMHAVEDAGLLKFDFLGIKNLAILADAVNLVEKLESITIDIDTIPLDDKKTFAMLSRGETVGLFQLNGSGMTRFLMDLKPTSIYDINAMVALYRPGPMEVIPDYIKRKNNPKLVKYMDKRMESFLKESYGLIVYQDDLLFCAIHLAGYSWLEADKFRKAVGKKIPAEMAAQHSKFVDGVVAHGQTKEFGETLWKLFEPFQAYGFNKAHAASYGRVAYQTSYMKANFPAIYMSAVLTADSGDVESIGTTIAECKRIGIAVLPPSINDSFQGFTVVKADGQPDQIRFGLTTIKNFGEGIGNSIIAERKSGGKFTSLADFLNRIKDRNLNKKSLEALIKTGALDELGERGSMLTNLETLLGYNKEQSKGPDNQDSLFGLMSDTHSIPQLRLVESEPATQGDKLMWEKELLGLYISGHPLDKYREKLEKRDINIAKLIEKSKQGQEVVLGGLIEDVREVTTKNNERMLFIKITDLTGTMEAVVFPRTFAQFKEVFLPDTCVVLSAKVSKRNGELSLIAEKAKMLE